LTAPAAGRRPAAPFPYARAAGSLLFFALGAWCALSGRAKFTLGGDDYSNRHPIYVDAHGMDAAAIGSALVGLGLVNLALGVRGRARLRVFWAGAAVLGATLLYGISNVVRDVADFLTSR
jgi:hypothetical protein